MAIVVNDIVHPTGATGFLTLNVYEDTGAALEVTVSVVFAGASTETSVYNGASFVTPYTDSSVAGAGTSASPKAFSIRPVGGWPRTSISVVRVEADTTPLAMPSEAYWDFRLHTTEAKIWLDKLIAQAGSKDLYFPDVRLALVVTLPQSQGALMVEVGQKCAQLGIPVFAGIQVMVDPSTFATGWGSAAHWLSMTADLQTVLDTFGPYWTDNHLQLDWEAYRVGVSQPTSDVLAAAGFTVAQCETAMAPFLALVESARRVPYMYPSNPDDVLAPLVTQIHGISVMSDETTFQWERRQKRDQADLEQFVGATATPRANQIMRENPGAKIVPASFDDLLRIYGQKSRNDDGWLSVCQRKGWVYKLTGSDFAAHVGSVGWYRGTVLSSLNDCVRSWYIAPDTIRTSSDRCYGLNWGTASAYTLDSWRLAPGVNAIDNTKTPQADGWHVSGVTDCKHFRVTTQSIVAASDWTFKVPGFILPPSANDGGLGNFSVIAGIGRVWQFGYDKVNDQLQLRTALGGVQTTQVVASAPARGTQLDYVISYQHSTRTWRVNGATNVTSNGWTGSSATLGLGAAFDIPTGDVVQGFDGLIFVAGEDATEWDRYLGTSEEVTARTGNYPRGTI